MLGGAAKGPADASRVTWAFYTSIITLDDSEQRDIVWSDCPHVNSPPNAPGEIRQTRQAASRWPQVSFLLPSQGVLHISAVFSDEYLLSAPDFGINVFQ